MLEDSSKPNLDEQNFKVIIMGDAGTGKTSIINRFIYNKYDQFTSSTVGVDNIHSRIKVGDQTVCLRIWDTAGQEQYSSLIPMFSRDSDVCILVADISRPDTIDHIEGWIAKLHESGENPPIIVAINKTDLQGPKPMELVRSELLVKYQNVLFVSAATGTFIKELFDVVARTAIENAVQEEEQDAELKTRREKRKQGCC